MTDSTSRLLTLLSLLQGRREWPGSLLAERLQVTPRTVRRDVDRLRALGYRITATRGPAGGYRMEAGSDLPPLLFDDEQAVAIAISLQSTASGAAVGDAAQRALASVRQVMPARLRHRVDSVRFGESPRTAGTDPSVVVAVSAAVRDRMTLRFDHVGSDRTRRTQPHGLVTRQGRWYLVAWDLDRDDWRMFRLDRISPRVPTGPRFTPRDLPTGDAETFVETRTRGLDDTSSWPCVGIVEIDLPAQDLAPWLPDAQVAPLTPRRTRVELGSWSWTGLLSTIIRLDAPFRLIGPPALLDAAATITRRLRTSHDTTSTGDAPEPLPHRIEPGA